MFLSQYIDSQKLCSYVHEGLVDVRKHPTLPLRLYTHTRRAVLENYWDEITTKCRGLIVHSSGEIIARPFEKFFNVDTSWRPETMLTALPLTKPWLSDKLDGSLGIMYVWGGKCYIATKGSFGSDQALWATEHLHKFYGDDFKDGDGEDKWPRGWTPIFEIIVESVQHHVVHYDGIEELVLLTLINNETGEEMDPFDVNMIGLRLGFKTPQTDMRSVVDALTEDRPNKEGYVATWQTPGQPPLKVKIKHPNFLALQKVVHDATPKAILESLMAHDISLLDTWIGQTNAPLGAWVKSWVVKFNFKFAEVLLKSKQAADYALSHFANRREFADYVRSAFEGQYASVAFAILDGKDYRKAVWKIVLKHFETDMSTPFATPVLSDEDPE